MEIVTQNEFRAGELPLALMQQQMGGMAKAGLPILSPMSTATASVDMEVEQFMVGLLDDETFSSTSSCPSSFCTGNYETYADDLEPDDADLIDELGAAIFDDDQDPVSSAGQSVSVALAAGKSAVVAGLGTGGGFVNDKKRNFNETGASDVSQPASVHGYRDECQGVDGLSYPAAYGACGRVGWNAATTAEDIQRQKTTKYRRTVAIPRYLRKKANRNWNKKAMYESRTKAARARSRINGKFVISEDSEPGYYFV